MEAAARHSVKEASKKRQKREKGIRNGCCCCCREIRENEEIAPVFIVLFYSFRIFVVDGRMEKQKLFSKGVAAAAAVAAVLVITAAPLSARLSAWRVLPPVARSLIYSPHCRRPPARPPANNRTRRRRRKRENERTNERTCGGCGVYLYKSGHVTLLAPSSSLRVCVRFYLPTCLQLPGATRTSPAAAVSMLCCCVYTTHTHTHTHTPSSTKASCVAARAAYLFISHSHSYTTHTIESSCTFFLSFFLSFACRRQFGE